MSLVALKTEVVFGALASMRHRTFRLGVLLSLVLSASGLLGWLLGFGAPLGRAAVSLTALALAITGASRTVAAGGARETLLHNARAPVTALVCRLAGVILMSLPAVVPATLVAARILQVGVTHLLLTGFLIPAVQFGCLAQSIALVWGATAGASAAFALAPLIYLSGGQAPGPFISPTLVLLSFFPVLLLHLLISHAVLLRRSGFFSDVDRTL